MGCKKCQELFDVICDININASDELGMHKSLAERLAYIVTTTKECIKDNPKIMQEGNDEFDRMVAGTKHAEPYNKRIKM